MAVLTNSYLTLLATAMQTNGNSTAITYVSVGTGAGATTAAYNSGTPYTSVAITAAYTGTISSSQVMTLVDSGGDTQSVTCNSTTNITLGMPATIPVNSFTPTATFAIGSGLVNTPTATDIAMQNETNRIAATAGSAGGSPGESLNPGYFDPSAVPTGLYLEVGYWSGAAATSSLGTGTLAAHDIQYWNHTVNADSAMYQLDTTL